MRGVHEDREGESTYFYAVYRRGSIVRDGDDWGVVTSAEHMYHQILEIIWWDAPGDAGWTGPQHYMQSQGNLSAPYAHTYAGIPDEVLTKATHIMLDSDA